MEELAGIKNLRLALKEFHYSGCPKLQACGKIQELPHIGVAEEKPPLLEDPNNCGFSSDATKDHLIKLESDRLKILKFMEETWRLKGRAIWLKVGDENTKLFKQYARGRRSINTILELENVDGTSATSFEQLANLGTSHFRNLFKAPHGAMLAETIKAIGYFPRFLDWDYAEELFNPVTMGELEEVLKWANE